MQRDSRPNGLNLPSPLPQRSRSLSSADRTPSVSGSSLAASPPVSPEPAYIAASAASQIVSTDRADRGLDMFDGEGKKVQIDTAVVSPGSLSLVNSFLDQLLYSFLAGSHSTSIAALRPAIAEVLKPRLAKEAIAGADEELQGYMTGGDAEELLAFHSGQEFRGDYDLNLVWRKTRLRCMVYTRLGDMEEDDEEMYLEQEREENGNDGRPRLSRDLGSVSPAAAIFLTSILEFLGEHALLVASEAACNRAHTKPPHPENLRAIVEEIDMEKLAFNGTLGRLWRSWKKRVRSSSLLSPRETARDLGRRQASLMSDSTGRKTSISEGDEPGYFGSETLPSATKGFAEKSAPTAVSADMKDLPEEPDFSSFSEELPIPEVDNTNRERRRSMIEFSEQSNETPERAPSQSSARCLSTPSGADKRLAQHRQRSSSLPVFRQKSSEFPMDEAFVTPSEVSNPYNDRGNAERNIPKLMDDVTNVPDLASGGGAASMMYDEPISKSAEVLPEQASKQQFRDVSTKTEFSSTADECDLEVSPRAFDHNQFSTPIAKTHSQSRDSAVLENGSLVVGERGLIAPRESLGERVHGNENQTQGEAYPPRGDSLDQPRDDSDGRTLVSVGNFANLATLQGHQLRTYDDSGKAVKRDIPVLYESPSNKDVIYNPEASIRSSTGPPFDEGKVTIPTMADSQIAGPEKQGMPPLKPLEELVDAAHVNNDAASSNVPSHNVSRSDSFVQGHQSKSSDSLRNGSMLSSSVNPGRETAASGKLIDLRSQPLLVSTGTEKSSVQRVPSFISSPTPPGKTPTGSNRDSRPLTAGSINSHKIKGLLGRDSADLIRQPVPTRNSSEGSSSLVNGSLRTPRSADKEQDFEDLIRSEETVRYTLTPQTVREMEVCC